MADTRNELVQDVARYLGNTTSTNQRTRAEALLDLLKDKGWTAPLRWKRSGTHSQGAEVTDGHLRINVRGPFGTGHRPVAADKLVDALNEHDIDLGL